MGTDLPVDLRRFFEPQAEQLGLKLEAAPFGYGGTASTPVADGWLWVAALGDSCLLSAHAVRPKRTFVLEERPLDYGCITSVSAATARECAPSVVPRHVVDRGNVLAFAQPAGTVSCVLRAGQVYEARNICLRPGFFRSLEQRHGGRFAHLLERFDGIDPDLLPIELDAVLQGIDPKAATDPRAGLLMEARVDEAVYLLAASIDEQERARHDEGARGQKALVKQARRAIDADLGGVPPLGALAGSLYVSRARLCAAFKQETGMTVGAYVRARRMERARALLARSDASVAEVAHEVGYRNAGSFTEAFERESGMAPSTWQRLHSSAMSSQ